jgi:pimeloyl-ACP methyl ester carboxylesterase
MKIVSEMQLVRLFIIYMSKKLSCQGNMLQKQPISIVATVVLPNPVAIAALTITSVALALLCIYKAADFVQPYLKAIVESNELKQSHLKPTELALSYLSSGMLKACEITTSFFEEIAALAMVSVCYFNDLADKEEQELDALIQNIDAGGHPDRLEKTPILLVHGYLANSFCWYWQKRRLEKEGFKVYTVNLGRHPLVGAVFDSIENDYADKVQKRIAKITKVHDCQQQGIVVVGHSMGGLVASEAATKMEESNIKAVISLGSPLNGTLLAPLGCALSLGNSPCASEMRHGSPFTSRLNKRVEECRKTHFYNLSSGTDIVILPNNSARFQHQPIEKYRHYRAMGHLQYLVSGEVADDLLSIINHHNKSAAFSVAPNSEIASGQVR